MRLSLSSLTLIQLIFPTLALSFQKTKPTRFYVDPRNYLDIIPALLPAVLRFATGILISDYTVSLQAEQEEDKSKYTIFSFLGYRIQEGTKSNFRSRPKKYLEVYEFEGCPFCRKVREAISILDLDVIYYPCPKGGPKFRTKVKKLGGKAQFPYLVDPNTNVQMYESADIIKYLYETYGNDAPIPSLLDASFFSTVSVSISSLPRLGKGSKFVENAFDQKSKNLPLLYWGYEGSPFCKIVREKLEDYEIPHIQKTCPRGSIKRQELVNLTSRFQVPYIEDPNTGVKLFESADIINYLDTTYGL